MPTTVTTRKAVKTISVSGIGTDMGLLSASLGGSYSTEVDSIAAYGDGWVTNVPRTEGKAFGDLTFEFLDEGATVPKTIVGTVVSVTITAKFNDGKATSDTTRTTTFDFAVKSCEPSTISIDGERKGVITITGVQHADTASA